MTLGGDEHPLAADQGPAPSPFFAPDDPPAPPSPQRGVRPAISEDDASSESWTS
jgi:hypothetical protein